MKPNLWLRVYEIVKPFRAKLFLATTTLFALTGLGLLPPIWGAKLVGVALPESNHDLFIECVVVLVSLHVGNSIISFAYGYQMRILGGRLVFDLRRRMYDHLQRLSLGFYESRSSGEIISRMMRR
jgi:ABC-type multidrug transport system fused ATPase/permease subunit